MKTLLKIIKDFPWFLWSGWGAIASIFLFLALWDYGNKIYGDLVLPSPKSVFYALYTMFGNEVFRNNLFLTIKRALEGLGISFVIGGFFGLFAGFFVTPSVISRPIVTILVGIPPIAWIVMAMIWFGFGGTAVLFVIIVTSFPIVFAGALEGSRTIDGKFEELCDAFVLTKFQKLTNLYIPHLFSYLFPSFVSALGMSWKVVVMAELLAASDGIGVELGIARTQLDTPAALALVCSMIIVLLFIEYVLLEPIRREAESWRG
ncbi:MAG: ABC transporter permease subunit [Campylobacteraceae bacterium]|jgi:NitT/TauT family transport system permease protein|nr:ABC transporter permease subunit [Campylobacteraceae bacterium]